MIVDRERTRLARERHEEGRDALDRWFSFASGEGLPQKQRNRPTTHSKRMRRLRKRKR